MTTMTVETCSGLSAGGFHELSYVHWGEADNPRVVFCVHGLTRNARDFDVIAERLSATCRVVCPDVVGRGLSSWLADKSGYQYSQYLADMAVVLAHARAESVDWIGTSMGGLIGMLLAAQPGTPIRRLVMNDVGPFIPLSALERIGDYVGTEMTFPDMPSMERHVRAVSEGFGPLTDAEWRHLCVHGAREAADGGVSFRYDPKIRAAFEGLDADVDLWPVWAAVTQPALVLRGADSDLLSAETAARMAERRAATEVVEFPGVGHAPMLMSEDQVEAVVRWLGA